MNKAKRLEDYFRIRHNEKDGKVLCRKCTLLRKKSKIKALQGSESPCQGPNPKGNNNQILPFTPELVHILPKIVNECGPADF